MARDKRLPMSKKEKKRQMQQENAKKPLAVGRILIVCEGEKTEPLYFNWWKRQLENIKRIARSRTIGEIEITIPDDEIEVKGEGRNTKSLVQKAIELKNRPDNIVDYTQIWCVFDRDSFKPEQYNAAIEACKGDIKAAYTNEAFELWYLLHFDYVNTGVSREQYKEKLTTCLYGKKSKQKYKKKDPEIYKKLLAHPKADQQRAIQHAKELSKHYEGQKNYADHNPSTTVHKLVEMLNDLVWRFRCQVAPTYHLPYPHDCEKECAESKKQPPSYPCKEIAS